jgi:hypothetical protein
MESNRIEGRKLVRILGMVGALALPIACWGQLPLPGEPFHNAGNSITGALEGWFPNPDGSFSILVGYYNRNLQQPIDVPIGPSNRIEPGGPDRGQPTHFVPGRQWGMFVVNVPKDFGTNVLQWTIVANGKPTVIPLSLKPDWAIAPFKDATDNTPPYLSYKAFDQGGPTIQGPVPLKESLTATVGVPLPLTVWAADDGVVPPGNRALKGAPVTVTWRLFRGPADVKFANDKPVAEKIEGKMPGIATYAGKAETTATFSEPGDYILWVTLNDMSGDGGRGFQCCWTIGHVAVTVKPGAGGVGGGQ